jgi:hypothetical protein
MACLIRSIEDLIVEDGKVEGKTQPDWVGGRQISLSNLGGSLVSLKRLVGGGLTLVANGELSKVAVVVTLPNSHEIRACPPVSSPKPKPYILW